jgi:glucosamine-6-phosphate deaminase
MNHCFLANSLMCVGSYTPIISGERIVIIKVFNNKIQLGEAAADQAAIAIERAVSDRGLARIIAATGASQFEFLNALIKRPGVDWAKVEMFHLDEYAGLPVTHPASFRKYLLERFIEPAGISNYHLIDGQADPNEVCKRLGEEIGAAPIDVAFVGIGENGHLAFNDPPADFETDEPYIVVDLDEACRRQQVGEGWFAGPDDVPKQAISMSVKQIMKSREIVCVAPESRKARAVKNCFEKEIGPLFPASILRAHSDTIVYLDTESSALLNPELISK